MSKLTEKPILFNTEMIKAVLEGRKTVTRRVIKLDREWDLVDITGNGAVFQNQYGETKQVKCPYSAHELWVRETWRHTGFGMVGYKDGWEKLINKSYTPSVISTQWKPSIHMPRVVSRIQLTVKSVTVERIQDINDAEIVKEGIEPCSDSCFWEGSNCCPYLHIDFIKLWDSINEKRGYGWVVNPWVWVVKFAVLTKEN